MTQPAQTEFRQLLLHLKDRLKEIFPNYQVRIYEPLEADLAPRQVWIALPDMKVDEAARVSGGAVPLVFSVLVNVIYDNVDGSAQSEEHYLAVADVRIMFARTIESVGRFASTLNMIVTLVGETTTIQDGRIVSGQILDVFWHELVDTDEGEEP